MNAYDTLKVSEIENDKVPAGWVELNVGDMISSDHIFFDDGGWNRHDECVGDSYNPYTSNIGVLGHFKTYRKEGF